MASPEKVSLKREKFGISADNLLGIYHTDLTLIAKELGHNNELVIPLFETGIYEARILCSKMFKPADMTENLMKIWVKTFENWETCDSFCMRLFANSVFAQKNTGNDVFKQFLPLIVTETIDDSLYVKKAVNWALRNIGKRNCDLNIEAIIIAKRLSGFESKSVKWIASNALIEL